MMQLVTRPLMGLRKALFFVVGALVAPASLPANANAVEVPAPSVRLAIVNTPVMSGLIQDLASDFRALTNLSVGISQGEDAVERARDGRADIVIAHYGKTGVKDLVLDGIGHWPQPVFANQLVLVGPKVDPAGVRNVDSLGEAYARIRQTKNVFVENEISGVSYLTKILRVLSQNGVAQEGTIVKGHAKGQAMLEAERRGGYVIWGAYPFLKFKKKHDSKLEILHMRDPLLQRMMVAIVVRKEKIPSANEVGAKAFLDYLVSPRAQARISKFRSPGSVYQLWWPRARDGTVESAE